MILALLLAGQLPADTFYNRAGARPGEVAAELARCRAIATGPMAGTTALGRPLGPPVAAGAGDRPPAEDLDACMRSRGWRLFAMGPALRRRLAALSPPRAARERARLEGARRPAGATLLREDRRLLLRPR